MFRTFDFILKNPNPDNTKNLVYCSIDYGQISIISIDRLFLCIELISGLGVELECIDP